LCLFLLYCILNTKNLEAWKFYVYFHVLGLRRVKKSEFVLRYNIALFAGHAIGANPAIPRMFPNMFPLVISQVYFCFFLPTLVMQCDVFSFISHILVSFLSCSYLCTPDMVIYWISIVLTEKVTNRRLIAVMKLSLDKSAQGERISDISKNGHIASYRWRS